jgi:hypothetical protein
MKSLVSTESVCWYLLVVCKSIASKREIAEWKEVVFHVVCVLISAPETKSTSKKYYRACAIGISHKFNVSLT